MSIKSIFAFSASWMLAASAYAGAVSHNYYISMSAGSSYNTVAKNDFKGHVANLDKSRFAGKVAFGKHISGTGALELAYINYGRTNADHDGDRVRLRSHGITAKYVHSHALSDRLSVALGGGVYKMIVSGHKDSAYYVDDKRPRGAYGITYSAGLRYSLTDKFGVKFDYDQILHRASVHKSDFTKKNTSMMSLGVVYNL